MNGRILWLLAGLVSLACGIIGAVLPLIPTTPFVLLSAYAFARSSPRMHCWLTNHRVFGPLIENWHLHGAISRRTKTISIIVMVLAPILTFIIGAPVWAIGAQIVVLCGAAAFVLSRPSGAKPKEDNSDG